MCQPELKLPSVTVVAIRSRTTFVSAMTGSVSTALAIPAPIAAPITKVASTIHFFDRSIPTAAPLPIQFRAVVPPAHDRRPPRSGSTRSAGRVQGCAGVGLQLRRPLLDLPVVVGLVIV